MRGSRVNYNALKSTLAQTPELQTLKAATRAAREAEVEAERMAEAARRTTNEARSAYFAAEALVIDLWIARSRRARRAS